MRRPAGCRQLTLGGTRQSSILAVLFLHLGQTIPKQRLIKHVWPLDPPTTAEELVVAHMSRLRKILNADGEHISLSPAHPGFRTDYGPDAVDARRLNALIR